MGRLGAPGSLARGMGLQEVSLAFLGDLSWLWAEIVKAWGLLSTPLAYLLAVLVTCHALLTQRDVTVGTGWIGLAWVAPTWGAVLYFLFGINRVTRRAKRARTERQPRRKANDEPVFNIPDNIVPLEHAIRRITGRLAERENAVDVFHNGDEAYPQMLAAIDEGRTSIALSSYIMRDDVIGRQFLEALAKAKGRGVEVRLLVDGIGSGYLSPITRHAKRLGLSTGLFMHSVLPWRMPFLNLRSHKKILVVDGAIGFTGGLNISDANVLARKPAEPVSDTHFRFAGPVVTQLMDAFAQDWEFTTGETLKGPAWFPEPRSRGAILSRVVTSGPDQDLEKVRAVLIEATSCAHKTIALMTPYFLPDDTLVTALVMAAMRGVEVDIVIPQRSDHRFVDLATRAHVGPLLDAGVRLWTSPPPFNHSKLLIVDRHWCLVGSANWDMRSLRLNFELNVEIYDDALAATLGAFVRKHRRTRVRARELNARSLPVRLRDAALRLLLPYI